MGHVAEGPSRLIWSPPSVDDRGSLEAAATPDRALDYTEHRGDDGGRRRAIMSTDDKTVLVQAVHGRRDLGCQATPAQNSTSGVVTGQWA